MTFGKKKGVKCYELIQILMCKENVFTDAHVVRYKGVEYETSTLNRFKQEMMGFEDNISFAKCSFLYHPQESKLIRLQLIRSRVVLDKITGGVSQCHPTVYLEGLRIECTQLNIETLKVYLRTNILNIKTLLVLLPAPLTKEMIAYLEEEVANWSREERCMDEFWNSVFLMDNSQGGI